MYWGRRKLWCPNIVGIDNNYNPIKSDLISPVQRLNCHFQHEWNISSKYPNWIRCYKKNWYILIHGNAEFLKIREKEKWQHWPTLRTPAIPRRGCPDCFGSWSSSEVRKKASRRCTAGCRGAAAAPRHGRRRSRKMVASRCNGRLPMGTQKKTLVIVTRITDQVYHYAKPSWSRVQIRCVRNCAKQIKHVTRCGEPWWKVPRRPHHQKRCHIFTLREPGSHQLTYRMPDKKKKM